MKNILIVGAGITGAVFANKLKDIAKVTVIDKRKHTAGNIHLADEQGIKVHQYGAHIFHTNNETVWDYMKANDVGSTFVPYTHKVKAINNGKLYTLPFNRTTLDEMGLSKFIEQPEGKEYANLEDYCINTVGWDIYDKLIRDYTTKQWGREPKDLPASIIKRIPIRDNYDDNYFTDKYQGLFDYSRIVDRLLAGTETLLGTDFFINRDSYERDYDLIIYTGAIDKLCEFEYGVLGWRCLRFESEWYETICYQSLPVINYTDKASAWTRIIEHKNFPHKPYNLHYTLVTKEYSENYDVSKTPDYPVNTEDDRRMYMLYRERVKATMPKYVLCGRLADYVYIDIHQAIAKALIKADEVYNNIIGEGGLCD